MRMPPAPLGHAWNEARAGRGSLVLLAGADDARVIRAVSDLVDAAKRDGARILGIATSPAPNALVATGDFDAAANVAEELRTASARAPHLVVAANVETAEPAALRFLTVLGRELRDAAVLLVATRGDTPAPPAVERELAALARAGKWLSLARPAAPSPERAALAAPVSIARDGAFWTIERAGRRAVVRDSRGMRWLAELLREPGRARSALELAGRADEGAGEALDAAARSAYRRELEALRIDTASRRDAAFLERALARDTGLAGRARRLDSGADRARVAVTRGIRRAIEAIAARDAELGAWLAESVRTGHECAFEPVE
jgi:hypothetical protein